MPIPGYYRIRFTDPSSVTQTNKVGSFIIEPFTTNGTNVPTGSLPDANANAADTSIVLHGKGMPDFGETTATALLNMLEHFAGPIPPNNPVNGQLWLDTGTADRIIGENFSADTITVSGDLASRITNIAAQPATIVVDTITVPNPAGTIRILLPDTNEEALVARPVSASYNVGTDQTTITLVTGTLSNISNLYQISTFLTYPCYLTTYVTRAPVLRVYSIRQDTGTKQGTWKNVNSIVSQSSAPDLPNEGELWIDTSMVPPTVKFYNAGTWSAGFVSISGGTLTGFLSLHADPTSPQHASTKNYVDVTVAAAELNLQTQIDGLDQRLDIVEPAVATLQSDVGTLQTDVGTLQTDVGTLQTDVAGKVDITGDTMTGNLQFNINENTPSVGVVWQGAVATTLAGFSYNLTPTGITNFSDLEMLMQAPAGANSANSTLTISYKPGAAADFPLLQLRNNAIFSPVGVFEEDPASVVIGSTPPAGKKYVTRDEYDTFTNSLGDVVTGGSFNDTTFQLTLDTVNWSNGTLAVGTSVIDMTHTHTNIEAVDYTLKEGTNKILPSLFPDTDGNIIDVGTALDALDDYKANRRNATFLEKANIWAEATTLTQDALNYIFEISLEDYNRILPQIGHSVKLYSQGTAGRAVIYFSGTNTVATATGLLPGTTYEVDIVVDRFTRVTVSRDGALLGTFGDVINEINNEPALLGRVTASVQSNNIVIESARIDEFSAVEVDENAFTTPLFGSITNFTSYGLSLSGTNKNFNYITTISDISVGATVVIEIDAPATISSPDVLNDDEMAIVEFPQIAATNPEDIITKGYLDLNYGYTVGDMRRTYVPLSLPWAACDGSTYSSTTYPVAASYLSGDVPYTLAPGPSTGSEPEPVRTTLTPVNYAFFPTQRPLPLRVYSPNIASTFYAVSGYRIYKTTNNWSTTTVYNANTNAVLLDVARSTASTNLVAVGMKDGGDKADIWFSTNNGSSWNRNNNISQTGNGNAFRRVVSCPSIGNDFIMVGSLGMIHRLSDTSPNAGTVAVSNWTAANGIVAESITTNGAGGSIIWNRPIWYSVAASANRVVAVGLVTPVGGQTPSNMGQQVIAYTTNGSTWYSHVPAATNSALYDIVYDVDGNQFIVSGTQNGAAKLYTVSNTSGTPVGSTTLTDITPPEIGAAVAIRTVGSTAATADSREVSGNTLFLAADYGASIKIYKSHTGVSGTWVESTKLGLVYSNYTDLRWIDQFFAAPTDLWVSAGLGIPSATSASTGLFSIPYTDLVSETGGSPTFNVPTEPSSSGTWYILLG